jgi:hypothetical protein
MIGLFRMFSKSAGLSLDRGHAASKLKDIAVQGLQNDLLALNDIKYQIFPYKLSLVCQQAE